LHGRCGSGLDGAMQVEVGNVGAMGLPIGGGHVGAGRLVVQGEAVEFNNTCGRVELVELDVDER
jgi:hypothetical protein